MSALPSTSSLSNAPVLLASCPKCATPRPPRATDCPSCGIVYAKVEARLVVALARRREGAGQCPGDEGQRQGIDDAVAPLRVVVPASAAVESPNIEERAVAGVVFWASAGLWSVLAFLTVRFGTHSVASNFAGASPLHLVNLVFHEAGHVLFSPFGRVVMVLGGSLLQVLVPLACAVAFVRRDDRFATAVAAWWAGQNLVDLAPYVNDARALQLVLLGGRTGAEVEGHDWEFLLQTIGVQQFNHSIAGALHALGILVMAAALGWSAWELKKLRRANGECDAAKGEIQGL